MPQNLYCWRCDMELPMLDEAEWSRLAPFLMGSEQTRATFIDSWRAGFAPALDLYFEITGFHETNVNALWHHRLSLYGPPCTHCGKPLRTPQAKLCAACGKPRG